MNNTRVLTDQDEHIHEEVTSTTMDIKSSQSEKKRTFWKCVRHFFRFISLAEYRTPLYFTNKDSYKSATSGFLTIIAVLVLAILGFNIFVPIFRMEIYKSESKQTKIRGAYLNGTVESCTNCKNFTVRDSLKYIFDGNQMLGIFTSKKET